MTPTLPDILRGNFMSLAEPQTPDMAGEFMTTRVGVIALLNLLAAQEAEHGLVAVMAENAAIRALLDGATAYDVTPLPAPDAITPIALDAHNAALRRALIRLHETVEARADGDTDRSILQLYVAMAKGRSLELPPLP